MRTPPMLRSRIAARQAGDRRCRGRASVRLLTRAVPVVVAFAALAAAACGGTPGGDEGPVDRGPASAVRLGYLPNITHAPALIGIADGLFTEALGPQTRLSPKPFNAGPAVIEALFAGEIDIAYVGPSPAVNGYVRSKGKALRILAGATSGGASLVVRPASGITTAADFAHKRVATPQLGNTQDVALRAWLLDHGLKAKEKGGSVTVLPVENATALTLFQKGDIDAAWAPEPWATRLVQAGGTIFLDERSLWPGGRFVTTNVIVRTAFLEEHPETVEAFLRGHVRAIQAIVGDPERAKATANGAIKQATGAALTPQVIDAAWKNLDFTYDPLAETLRASADSAFKLGFLGAHRPNLSAIYDFRPLNAVLAALGVAPVQE